MRSLTLFAWTLTSLMLPGGEKQPPDEFWHGSQRRAAISAAQLVSIGDFRTAAAMRLHVFDQNLWKEPPPLLDRVPSLDPHLLAAVRDDTPFSNWEHALPSEVPQEARDEDAVFWQALLNASRTPAQVFAAAAEKNRYLTFGHLYGEPSKYRGQIVHIEGRLVRLKRLDPPHHAQLRGIRCLFEAWIYLDQPGTHPVCVVMPAQPEGIEPGDGLRHRMTVDGYFLKRYSYISGRLDAAGNNVALNTLLLIAPTAKNKETPISVSTTGSEAEHWGPWLAGFGASVAILIIGMTWWFRHNDRKVQAQLSAFRFFEPPEVRSPTA